MIDAVGMAQWVGTAISVYDLLYRLKIRTIPWWERVLSGNPLTKLTPPLLLISSNFYFAGSPPRHVSLNTRLGARLISPPLFKVSEEGRLLHGMVNPLLVAGVMDTMGQVQLAAVLGRGRREFSVMCDIDRAVDRKANSLICFGSPSSNLLSRDLFEELKNRLAQVGFHWGEGAASFSMKGETFTGGNCGVVLNCASPWLPGGRIIVLAGLGAYGTLGAAKYLCQWTRRGVPPDLRKAKEWIAALSLNIAKDGRTILDPDLRAWSPLD